jgi:hypothetical protein
LPHILKKGVFMSNLFLNSPLLRNEDEEFIDESHKALIDWTEKTIDEFFQSSFCKKWNNKRKNTASFFIHCFVDFAYGYHLAKPKKWNVTVVKDVCLNIFPRKISTNVKDFKYASSSLIAFLKWLESEKILKNTVKLQKKLESINNEIYERAKDPNNWGMAKSLFCGF